MRVTSGRAFSRSNYGDYVDFAPFSFVGWPILRPFSVAVATVAALAQALPTIARRWGLGLWGKAAAADGALVSDGPMLSHEQPLRIASLCKNYGKSPAVCGVDLAVAPGEILTLLGPSGCGKTTTLRLIAGFERPDRGEVTIGGKVVASGSHWIAPEERGVGMVFQDYALFPHLTVAENVAFGLGKADTGNRKQRVSQMLRLVGLEEQKDRYPHNLSGGQQQRVALARALAPRPALVLLDEPFSNLDASLRVQMREEVRRILKESGAAAIFVTHDQKDALAISDRVVVMNQGLVEQVGSPREIYQFPHTAFVARFVGQTNLLIDRKSVV